MLNDTYKKIIFDRHPMLYIVGKCICEFRDMFDRNVSTGCIALLKTILYVISPPLKTLPEACSMILMLLN